MKTFHLSYWTKKPHSVLIKETRKFRNTAEAYRFISEKGGLPVLVSENRY